MQSDDFFYEADDSWGPNAEPWQTKLKFDGTLVDAVRRGPTPDHDELEVAQGLTDLVHEELEAYGTHGRARLTDKESALAIRALHAVLKRLSITLELPFRDFTRFRSYWSRNGASGSWQARRDILETFFEPLVTQLTRMEEASLDELAEPVSPRRATGWSAVDEEIRELRRRFRTASTPQDYRAVGTHCVGVIEALSRTVYDPAQHLRPGETEPPVNKSKQRIDRYIEAELPGAPNEEFRGLAKRAVAAAHQVKHQTTPNRREAGIASDTVVLLANILRRLGT
ncbi:hypothetical protein FHX42_001265 [Saccharopolyspora lacisalsi]|uniref:Uncharacterized protein n=1 Tax=Halosaccharopolyspora lacisalsi TaxID=1000566 RepID=A0A839DUJ3_9PSEU|nr:hypothetical protein [Halosaccharopolyspora lacisalsi]MBA8823936.1 hypothetical protein [Halosaccharopolyspora lacisalsi]